MTCRILPHLSLFGGPSRRQVQLRPSASSTGTRLSPEYSLRDNYVAMLSYQGKKGKVLTSASERKTLANMLLSYCM
jgi:hypothetical protein